MLGFEFLLDKIFSTMLSDQIFPNFQLIGDGSRLILYSIRKRVLVAAIELPMLQQRRNTAVAAPPFTTSAHYHSILKSSIFTIMRQNGPFNLRYYSTKIHQVSKDYSTNHHVARSNWMITKLSREGRIWEARQVFDEMPERDIVTWTTMITGYLQCGLIEGARELFDRVDSVKNVVAWTAMVRGYVRIGQIMEAERLFYETPDKNVVSWNTMIDGYVRSGEIDKGLALFGRMPVRNVVSWNIVLTGLAQCGRIDEARMCFHRMPERDAVSWTAMIAGLSKNERIDEARAIFDSMPERNVVSWNAMIAGYTQNLRLDEGFDLFQRMPERDIASWNTMITGFIQNDDVGKARELFNEMPSKNVISWTSMITGYVQEGQNEEALKIFSEMQKDDGVRPNQGTFVSVLSACSSLAGLTEGKQIHQIISKTRLQNRAFVVSALINMYSKCGHLESAKDMFDDFPSSDRDLVIWNAMIAAYAHHGCGDEAIKLFEEMRYIRLKPDDVTYIGLLSACSHAGLTDDGLRFFNELLRDRSIKPRADHYACLVDLCGRAGRIHDAFNFIGELTKKPSSSVWGALLAGCSVHGNEDLGMLAVNKLLEVKPKNAGSYMLLSNIYASMGKWGDAAKVRLKMKNLGVKKEPGCSWVEVENQVHVFVVGNKSHHQSELIHFIIQNLHLVMENAFSLDEDLIIL